jgi:hypothetical protein
MSPDNRARVFKANARARHPRIAIGINEIDLPTEEDVTVVRAARDKNQRADENEFRQEREAPPHAPFKSAQSAFRNPKFILSARQQGILQVFLDERPAG